MPEKIQLKITGMSCKHCVMRVRKAVESIRGVKNVVVDLAAGTLSAETDKPGRIEEIREKVEETGYQAS